MAVADGQSDAKYKAAEVCRMADVQPYVLRYWESEFPFLAANRNAAGPRSYSESDLQLIRRIKQLLYDEGYTIAGAKKRLETELKKGVPLFDDSELAPPDLSDAPPPEGEASAVSASTGTKARRKPREAVPPALPAPVEVSEASAISGVAEPGADPRMAQVVAELKQILNILSSE